MQHQLFMPEGYAYGVVTLYQVNTKNFIVSAPYSREDDRSIRHGEGCCINWSVPPVTRILSGKAIASIQLRELETGS